jgi:hypothetical protein
MWAFFAVSLSAIGAAILLLLRRYAARDVPAVVLVATAYAWLVSFGVIALVPIDVWTTLVRARALEEQQPAAAGGGGDGARLLLAAAGGWRQDPDPSPSPPAPAPPPPSLGESSPRGLNVLWAVAYWSTQVLTWLLLPFFQVYSDAGDFTVGARCLTSLRENGALYGAAAAAGLVGLVALAIAQGGVRLDQIAGLGMALSNTFGLCAGMLLLGYGLVQIPREAWRTASPEQQLRWCCHRAGRFSSDVIRRTNELETVVTVICANERQMPRRDPLRPLMDEVADRAEKASPVRPSDVASRGPLDLEALSPDDLEYNYDRDGLAALRRRLNSAIASYAAAHAQYEAAVAAGIKLEAVVKARQRGDFSAESAAAAAAVAAGAVGGGGSSAPAVGAAAGSAAPSSSNSNPYPLLWRLDPRLSALAWRLRCTAAPPTRRLAAALLAVFSLAIVWSELTIFTGRKPDLSPFSLLVHRAAPGEWSTQALTLLPLAYVCGCVYFALFRLNVFSYNKLTPGATTGAGLMQNGSLLARFAAPTCWNVLHVLHMDGVVASGGGGRRRRLLLGEGDGGESSPPPSPAPAPAPPAAAPATVEVTTVFTRNMGTMQVLPALGNHLNVWLPALLAAHCALIYLGTWDKVAASCAPSRYRFAPDDSAADDAYTERGRALIRRERECVASGMRIGDLLHGPDLGSEFPDLARRRVRLGGGGGNGNGGGGGRGGGGPLAWLGFGRGRNDGGGGSSAAMPTGLSSATYLAQQRPLPPSVSSSPAVAGPPAGGGAGEERRPLWGAGGGGNSSSSNNGDAPSAGRSLLSSLLANRHASPISSPQSELVAPPATALGGGGAPGAGGGGGNGGGTLPPRPPANLDSLFDELSGGSGRR